MDKFDFQEALSYIKCGEKVSLEIEGKNRVYFLEGNNIVCIPNGKDFCKYVVKSFKIDAIMSNNWMLCS